MRRLCATVAAAIPLVLSAAIGTLAQTPDDPAMDSDGQRLVSGREVIDPMLARTTPETRSGYVTQQHGWEKTLSIAMDDPWVSGTGRCIFDVDIIGAAPDAVGNVRGGVARDTGTLRIENEGGAWEGPCDGVSTDAGGHVVGSCVLLGSGEYEGASFALASAW